MQILSASFRFSQICFHNSPTNSEQRMQILSASFRVWFSRFLTNVDQKMQIPSASFRKLFPRVFRFFSLQSKDADFICQLQIFVSAILAVYPFSFSIVLLQVILCRVLCLSGPPEYDVKQGNPISTLPPNVGVFTPGSQLPSELIMLFCIKHKFSQTFLFFWLVLKLLTRGDPAIDILYSPLTRVFRSHHDVSSFFCFL